MKLYVDEGRSLATGDRREIMRPFDGWQDWQSIDDRLVALSDLLLRAPVVLRNVQIILPQTPAHLYDVDWFDDSDPPRSGEIEDFTAQLYLGAANYRFAISSLIGLAAYAVAYPVAKTRIRNLADKLFGLNSGLNPQAREAVNIFNIARYRPLPDIFLRGGKLPARQWMPAEANN